MQHNHCFEVRALPDIEMYGGDTTPWEVTLMCNDGTRFSADVSKGFAVTLTLTPFKASSGFGNNANTIPPILTKTGIVETKAGEGTIVTFEFEENDTKGLRGKFIYQIEIRQDENLRICQGSIYIKQNINR